MLLFSPARAQVASQRGRAAVRRGGKPAASSYCMSVRSMCSATLEPELQMAGYFG